MNRSFTMSCLTKLLVLNRHTTATTYSKTKKDFNFAHMTSLLFLYQRDSNLQKKIKDDLRKESCRILRKIQRITIHIIDHLSL